MTGSTWNNRWLGESRLRGDSYDRRFDDLAAAGHDVHGEASLVASLGAGSVLDAGCGTGRVAIELARRGFEVMGVDIDPEMLATAHAKAPGLPFLEGDLAIAQLGRDFDRILLAGNVLAFLAPGSEGAVVANLARHLQPGGLLISGYGLSPNVLSLARFDELAGKAGLRLRERYATWERGAFDSSSNYAVSIHWREPTGRGDLD